MPGRAAAARRVAPPAARLALAALAALALPALAGCAKSKGTLRPNVPPETFVFVQGPVDTVNHRVRLHWFGSDPDGDVVAFELRFLPKTPGAPIDTTWGRVAAAGPSGYDSLFTVPTPTGLDSVLFEVRAVDDEGALDPTPARQDFTFSNAAASVVVTGAPAPTDTTFASATVDFVVDDPDGDATRSTVRLWLNSSPTFDETTARRFTVPSGRFRLPGGAYFAGRCTLNLQAVDDGGRVGPVTRVLWTVRAPATVLTPQGRGRVLVVDDAPSGSQGNFGLDTLYANTLARNLPAGTYSILRLQFSNPFRSGEDLAQTLRLFDAVVWYRGDTGTYTGFGAPNTGVELLAAYQDSIYAWIDAGGRFYLECMNPVDDPAGSDAGSRGPLRREFLDRYADSDSLRTYIRNLEPSVAFGNANGGRFRSSLFDIGVRAPVLLQTVGLRAFAVRDTRNVVLWAMPGALNPSNVVDYPVAVATRQPAGGRVMLVTYPVRFNQPAYSSTAEVMRRLLFDPLNGLVAAP